MVHDIDEVIQMPYDKHAKRKILLINRKRPNHITCGVLQKLDILSADGRAGFKPMTSASFLLKYQKSNKGPRVLYRGLLYKPNYQGCQGCINGLGS